MGVVTRSLWLPIDADEFYSAMTDPELLSRQPGNSSGQCRSSRPDQDPGYVPFLRESVLRRLAEVLPVSFGYDPIGVCEFSDDRDDRSRPVSITMTLRPASARVALDRAASVNTDLVDARVATVTLRVDEVGFYTFTATHDDSPESGQPVGEALAEHMVMVFGGDFGVSRLEPSPDRRRSESADAVRRYNGLPPIVVADNEEVAAQTPPLGVLSFYQLNVMLEGLCNQSLLPAVFFEHYLRAEEWLATRRRKSSMLTNLDDYIREITVAADASTPAGQMTTLHRFMTISRGSLQWMRRSVESVRRSLLDQMMAVSHRQARLIQLDLAGIDYERTPEMTGEATESQMRGYVMLVATKLPLMFTIADGAKKAMTELAHRTEGPRGPITDELQIRMSELNSLVASWIALLDRLRINVGSLETAVVHDWQERLLYEQEQARSEQEAMAEIERSRRGRPESRRMGDAAYNAIMLLLTAVAVFVAIQAADTSTTSGMAWWEVALKLWPVAVVAALFFFAWPVAAGLRHLHHQRRPNNDTYSFEFAFRLDERAEQDLVREYLSQPGSQLLRSAMFKVIKLRRLGGWRVERISADTTLVKVHSVAVIRVARVRFARFEIVTEIMVRRISDQDQFFVRQCRIFGDSPTPLRAQQVVDLVGELLRHTCAPLAKEFNLAAMTDSIDLLRPNLARHSVPD